MQAKQDLRIAAAKALAAVPQRQLRSKSRAICQRLLELPEYTAAESIFCYVSTAREVETAEIIRCALAEQKRVFVPRSKSGGIMDAVEISSPEQLLPGRFGIPEPSADIPPAQPEEIALSIIPAVACSLERDRLGHGGGYYDRYLPRLNCPVIALCFEVALFPSLPAQEYDRKPDIIISEKRIIR